MLDTDYYRGLMGLPTLTDRQLVLAIRLMAAYYDPDPWMSDALRYCVRKDWRGSTAKFDAADTFARNWAESKANYPHREELVAELFELLALAIPPA
jgi:hypothetical protein